MLVASSGNRFHFFRLFRDYEKKRQKARPPCDDRAFGKKKILNYFY
jgi:hypothetical protein